MAFLPISTPSNYRILFKARCRRSKTWLTLSISLRTMRMGNQRQWANLATGCCQIRCHHTKLAKPNIDFASRKVNVIQFSWQMRRQPARKNCN
jgi:hypothetical protein